MFLRSIDAPGLPANQDAWLLTLGLAGPTRLTVASPPNQIRFLAYGGRPPFIAYADDRGISLMRTDGTGAHPVLADDNVNELAIAPDSSRIAYVRNDTNTTGTALRTVGIADHAVHTVFQGTIHTCSIGSPSWSPDGRWLAFSLCTDKGGLNEDVGIWLVRPNGQDLHRIVRTAGNAAWSPDGRWIAFVSSKENAAKNDQLSAVLAVHPDGRGLVRLTPTVPVSRGDSADELDW